MINQFFGKESKSVHLILGTAKNSSRVLKFTKSLIDEKIVSKCIVVAIWEKGLQRIESIDEHRTIIRLSTPLSELRASGKLKNKSISRKFIAVISLIVLHLRYFRFVLGQENVKFISCHIVWLLLTGVILKKISGAALIYQPHELETETNGLKGVRKKLAQVTEKKLIRKCDLVFVVSENIADWYAKEYNITRPVVVKNTPKLFEQRKTNHFRADLGIKEESVIVLYQGGLFKGRGVNLLLECFKRRDDDKVVIVFMGYGELEEEIKEASWKRDNIFFYPAVAPEIVLDYTSSADIGIHMIQNTCLNHYYCLPNKLFEYAMAGLPVVVSNMKEMREFIEKYKWGVIVDDDEVTSMMKAIDKILVEDLNQMKKNARICAEENAWETQQKIILSAYHNRFLN